MCSILWFGSPFLMTSTQIAELLEMTILAMATSVRHELFSRISSDDNKLEIVAKFIDRQGAERKGLRQ